MTDRRAPVELSILLVNWNTRDMTLACLASVFEQTTRTSFEVIVVDNGSSDGSAEAIAAAFPQVTLLAEPVNHGFGHATNMQANLARGEKLLLLNTDTLVLDHAIDALAEFAHANPDAGIWGGRTLFGDGTLNSSSCWGRMTPWSVLARSLGLSALAPRSALFNPRAYPGWARDSERRVDIVTGCLLMIDAQLWKRLGGFDPRFFMYGEEVDLCLRAARTGARPMITPRATIVHYGGGSTVDRADKAVRNLFAERTIIKDHFPSGWRGISKAFHVFGVALRAGVYGIAGRIQPGRFASRARLWGDIWQRRAEWMG
jgi:GT2 family glycosyltransferase